MINRTGTLFVTALLIAAPTETSFGQGTWTAAGRVDVMVQAVINALGRDLAAEALTTQTRPWRISVTSPDSVRWHGVLGRVLTMLHGRAPAPTDREVWVLAIRERERTDSGSVYSLTVGQRWRCGGSDSRWVATYEEADIVVRHRASYWEAVPDPHPVIGDPAPCGVGAPARGRVAAFRL